MDRSQDRRAPIAWQRAPGSSCRFPPRGLPPGVSTRPPPDPPLRRRHRLTSYGSRVAPGTCCPGAKKILQALSKTAAPALQNNPPPFPATRAPALEHRVCSAQPGSAALSLHHFLRCPPRAEMPARSAAWGESRPGLRVPRSGSRRAVVAEVNGARVGEGGWVARLPLPASSSSGSGSGAFRAGPVRGSESRGCARRARELAWPRCGRRGSRCRARSSRAPGAAALAKTHRREHGARSQKLVMSSVQREPHLLFF